MDYNKVETQYDSIEYMDTVTKSGIERGVKLSRKVKIYGNGALSNYL